MFTWRIALLLALCPGGNIILSVYTQGASNHLKAQCLDREDRSSVINFSSGSFSTISFLEHIWTKSQNQPAGDGMCVSRDSRCSRAGAQAHTPPSLSADHLLACITFSDPSGDWECKRDTRMHTHRGPPPKRMPCCSTAKRLKASFEE